MARSIFGMQIGQPDRLSFDRAVRVAIRALTPVYVLIIVYLSALLIISMTVGIGPRFNGHGALEEVTKLFGIATWLTYCVGFCMRWLRTAMS
jgi:hypothetical protein